MITVLVKNLSLNISPLQLQQEFNKIGPCKIKQFDYQGSASVQFQHQKDALKAMDALDDTRLGSNIIKLSLLRSGSLQTSTGIQQKIRIRDRSQDTPQTLKRKKILRQFFIWRNQERKKSLANSQIQKLRQELKMMEQDDQEESGDQIRPVFTVTEQRGMDEKVQKKVWREIEGEEGNRERVECLVCKKMMLKKSIQKHVLTVSHQRNLKRFQSGECEKQEFNN